MSDQSDPAVANAPARHAIPPGRHHVHLSYVVLRTLRSLKEYSVALIAIGLATIPRIRTVPGQSLALALGAAVLVVLGLVGFSFLAYKRFAWELTADELHVYKGIIFKNEAHIPLQRIHAIDYSAKVTERVLGIVTLRVETAGGGQKAEAEIPALRLAEAEALRFEVFARKRALASAGPMPSAGTAAVSNGDVAGELGRLSESARGAFAGTFEDETPVEYEHRLTVQELLLAGISNSNTLLLTVASVGGLAQVLGIMGGSDSAILDFAQGAASRLLSYGIAVAAVVGILGLLSAWTISIGATLISYGGFVVRRRGGRIDMEKGLLEHRFSGVAIDRIQSVRIKQGALRRLIGFAEVSLETVSSASPEAAKEGTTGLVIHPLIRRSLVTSFIADLLPEFSHIPADLTPLSKRARSRSIFRATLWPGLAVGLTASSFSLWVQPRIGISMWLTPLVAFGLLVPFPIAGYLSWKARGHARDRTMLVFRTGSVALDTRIVPRTKIQWAKSSAGPLQRRFGLAGISVWTAAGVGGSAVALNDVDETVAREILEWVEPRSATPARA